MQVMTSQLRCIWTRKRTICSNAQFYFLGSYNIIEANNIGCDIITVTDDLIKRCQTFYDLEKFSSDTVKMFFDDATRAGYKFKFVIYNILSRIIAKHCVAIITRNSRRHPI